MRASSVEMHPDRQPDTNETNVDEQIQLNAQGEENAGSNPSDPPKPLNRSFSVDSLAYNEKKDTMIKILLVFLITYSVIVSTIALIIASSSSSSSACDCSLNGLVQQSEFIVGDSGFCDLVDSCVDLKATHNPTVNPSKYPSMAPSVATSLNPSQYPSLYPTTEPTLEPTTQPTNEPTLEPTQSPSMEPTIEPTLDPTTAPTYFDGYFIGDFKLSLQNNNHGFWRLCDGTLLPIDGVYSILFEVIGYTFGSYNDSNGTMHFLLPNAADSVLGIGGSDHPIGEQSGDEGVVLGNSNMPPHRHPTVRYGSTGDGTSSYSDKSLCNYYNPQYHLRVCNGLADTYSTGYQWEGYGSSPISVIQPTSFISNLFIYAGVQS